MRPVRSATWTSGDPVSVSWRRCSAIVAAVSGMREETFFRLRKRSGYHGPPDPARSRLCPGPACLGSGGSGGHRVPVPPAAPAGIASAPLRHPSLVRACGRGRRDRSGTRPLEATPACAPSATRRPAAPPRWSARAHRSAQGSGLGLEDAAGGLDVLGDLLDEVVDAVEALLAAQALDEAHRGGLVVEVALEVEEVRLEEGVVGLG